MHEGRAGDPNGPGAAASAAALLAGLVVAAGSLVVRYRRARGTEIPTIRLSSN